MRSVAAAVAVVLSAAAGASAAATDYWAFGDSVTRGTGDPVAPTVVFDTEGSPTGSCPRSACGYNWRLRSALTTAGISNDVINRGWGAEDTAAGLSRIDNFGEPLHTSRCTDPNAGDVLLLMEGTNDVSSILLGTPGYSTTTSKNNLAAMLDLATTKCVHSVVASTIRRLLSGTSIGSKTGDPGEPTTSDLAGKISALANDKNREFIDVFASLCPDQPCYNNHVWGRLSTNEPGHVDASGYGVMSPLFEAAIVASPLAGTAILTAPAGNVTDSTPDFTWNEHSDSDWYYLEVDGGAAYGRWHAEEAICGSGTCSFSPSGILADGEHTWRVRTRNLRGVGNWSSTSSFSVWTTLPGIPQNVYPLNDVFDTTPTYRWRAASGATSYDVQVDGGIPAAVDNLAAGAVCSGSSCEIEQPTSLSVGPHSWRVRAANPLGDGGFSPLVNYDVLNCASYPDLVVDDLSTPPFIACGTISTAVTGFTVGGTDNVSFHAGVTIELGNGFTVLTGGTFTARTDY